ncbi:TrbI/VirB10 family protein [Yersinia ruckeri]|nr:TrbI/VirB10 family protein [Yersinia ruckeri]
MSIFDKDKSETTLIEDNSSIDRSEINIAGQKTANGSAKIKITLFLIFIAVVVAISLSFFMKKVRSSDKQKESIAATATLAEKDQYEKDQGGSQLLKNLKNQSQNNDLASLKSNIENQEAETKDEGSKNAQAIVLPEPETQTSKKKDEVTPEQRKLMGAILLPVSNIANPEKKEENLNRPLDHSITAKSEGDFLKGASFADGKVMRVKNREFLLSAGTAMTCVLKTKIVTSYPAVVMCQLTKDIYSDDGKNMLIRGGALLTGEQTRVMQQGVARVFVNWSTVKDGSTRVRIDALGADGLGAAGLPAWIDSHFWERFGGAIMLSFIDDALAAAASHASNNSGSGGVTLDNTSGTSSKMAELALENSINIPATAYVNQGEMLSVIVPRNIDFSSVYGNE